MAVRSGPSQTKTQREVVDQGQVAAMLDGLDRGTLRGLRDRAILLLGSAGALRRSEIVGLDAGPDESTDGLGWVNFRDGDLLVSLRRRTGLQWVEIAGTGIESTCPIIALRTWLRLAKIHRGPLFRRVTGGGKIAGPDRLNPQEVARLVKRTALAAGIGNGFSAQSLRSVSAHRQRPVEAAGDEP